MLLVLLASFASPKWHCRQNSVVDGAEVLAYVEEMRRAATVRKNPKAFE